MYLTIVKGATKQMSITDEEFFHRLYGLIKDVYATMQRSPHPTIFRGQGRIVETIAHHPNCSQREIAKIAHVKPGSLTEVLERLEKGGYISRLRDSKDRRVIRVNLTQQGEEFRQDLIARRRQFGTMLLHDVSDDERQQFVAVLDKMEKQLRILAREGNDQE